MKILISAPYMQPIINKLLPLFQERNLEVILPVVKERLEERDLLPIISDIDGVICGDDRFTRKVLSVARKLRVISKWGTGIDSIDKEACQELSIAVLNTPNAFSEPVADSVLGYMLCFARGIPWATEDMRCGKWNKRPGFSLGEATLGVIGIGNVGKAVIRRALAFGMRIVGNDTAAVDEEYLAKTGINMRSLKGLLGEADFVSINCDLNDTSYHLLGHHQFSVMKHTAVVINTARGPIIDELALVSALHNKLIAGAGLDVFEDEPLPVTSPLRTMSNVLLASHNSNSSPFAWERVHLNTLNNLFYHLGKPLLVQEEAL
jgi:D-3-phosphoglycerate dehydrogenase